MRTQWLLLNPRPPARFAIGGWTALVGALERHARSLGVEIVTGLPVNSLPEPPVIIALELRDARRLLDDQRLRWPSGNTVCLDLALRARRGDPTLVSDLDGSGWIGRYSAQDASLAPPGEQLVQAQLPIWPGETADDAGARLERLLDSSFEDWRTRVTWRRRQVMDGRSGALDLPGTTWRDRPAIERGDGIFLCRDQVVAPGCLAEVSLTSAINAGRLAVERAGAGRSGRSTALRRA